MENYQIKWGRSANNQPRIKAYLENSELINPPIPTTETGNKLLDQTKTIMEQSGLEELTITAKKLKS
ncbi:MAG: hypothetical protein PHH54_03190 [Candidatus Nanoarchaeia archaeon]|nr:hypothetical protein [Candidatus Nanoarchaeia archaeon]